MLNRFNGNVEPFAVNATATNRTIFGDVTQSDDIDDNLNADFKTGWEIVGINDNPTKQDFNALAYTLGNLVSYLYQQGIAVWNTNQKYYVGSRCIGSNGLIYKALTGTEPSPNTGNDPVTDAVNWKQFSADEIKYDNSSSNLSATQVKTAIDELDSEVGILNFINSKLTSGYQKLPNGLIIQWGKSGFISDGTNSILPLTFPNALLNVSATMVGALSAGQSISCYWDEVSSNLSSIRVGRRYANDGGGVGLASQEYSYIAIGY